MQYTIYGMLDSLRRQFVDPVRSHNSYLRQRHVPEKAMRHDAFRYAGESHGGTDSVAQE